MTDKIKIDAWIFSQPQKLRSIIESSGLSHEEIAKRVGQPFRAKMIPELIKDGSRCAPTQWLAQRLAETLGYELVNIQKLHPDPIRDSKNA